LGIIGKLLKALCTTASESFHLPTPGLPIVILCGGLGTRLCEETEFKPKPMVEIGGKTRGTHESMGVHISLISGAL